MSELDKFTQPDLYISIDKGGEYYYQIGFSRPPMPQAKKIDLPEGVTPKRVEDAVVLLRAKLSEWSKKYETLLDGEKKDGLSCKPDKVKELWAYLADWGRGMYMLLFDLQVREDKNLVQWSERIKKLEEGAVIHIDPSEVVIPWGLLYDEDVPDQDDPDFMTQVTSHFWGFRYQLEVRAPYVENDDINRYPYLENQSGTRLTVAVNKKSDGDYKTQQFDFFNKLKERFKFSNSSTLDISPVINTEKAAVIASMMERQEPQHLYYFFCHHEKGDGKATEFGTNDHQQPTQLMMEGTNGGIITLQELIKLTNSNKIKTFQYPPLIFLNACDSGQQEVGDPNGFMLYFIRNLSSWDYIGTEANVPAMFADDYGRQFVEQFLGGERVGKIIFSLNRHYAANHFNPFGLYYRLFGLAEIRLETRVEEIKK